MSEDDDGWRERLGIDFTIDLSDDDFDDENNGKNGSSKNGTLHSQILAKRNSISDEFVEDTERTESVDSFTQEEEELAHYLSEFGKTPPRTVRHRRQKERDAYCSQAKVAAKTLRASLKRKNTADRFLSLPGFTDPAVLEAPPERTRQRQQYRELKRTQDRQRSHDRQFKAQGGTFESVYANAPNLSVLNTLGTPDNDERCESLPPLSPLFKLESRTRYRSVSSRKKGVSDDIDEENRLSKDDSVVELLPKDRVSYYEQLQQLVRIGNQDNITFNQRQKSEEEVIYQQELFEILWLELQAWQSGLDSSSFDTQLIAVRHQVLDIIDEVMNFNFDMKSHEKSSIHNFDRDNSVTFSDLKITGKVSEPKMSDRGIEININDSIDTVDGVGMSRMSGDEECTGCLSIWCISCKDRQTEAIIQVANLLKKLDYVESLFPSTKKLAFHFVEWEQPEFVSRYKALCVWYNTTVQLRMKIEVLGKLLGNMTNTLIPWPKFDTTFGAATPTSSYDSGHCGQAPSHYEESPEVDQTPHTHHSASSVRFIVDCDKSESSSNPSDSNNSTDSGHTTGSTNSGLLMPPSHHPAHPPSSGGLKRCLSDLFVEANPYRKYVEKLLRNKGMKKTFDKVGEVIRDMMMRTMCILDDNNANASLQKSQTHRKDLSSVALAETSQELRRHGPWMSKFEAMDLPPFNALFIFLASVSLQMMRECLKLRLEQMPEKPSRLSIKELMREYKEGVKFAVLVRQKYLLACQAVFVHLSPKLQENLELRQNQAIEELDGNIKRMLEVYLEWLDQFVCMLHREPHASGLQRNFLQEEWRFVQATCPHVTEGDSLAATRFCNIACHMLCSVGFFIDTGIDDQMSALQDSTIENLDEITEEEEEALDIDDLQKKRLLQRCRALQVLLVETRERSLRAAGLAKMLRKDLEVAAEFKVCGKPCELLGRLKETGHIRVIAPYSHNHFIFVPNRIKDKREYIWRLMDMRVGGVCVEDEEFGGYLVLMRCDDASLSSLWYGDVIEIEPTADCTITLSRVTVTMVQSVLVVVGCGNQLGGVRREFQQNMSNTVDLIREQTTPNRAITHSLDELKKGAMDLCESLTRNLKEVESMLDLNTVTPDVEEAEKKQLHLVTRDVIHQYFIFAFEYHKEVTRLVSGQHRANVTPMLVNLARTWMKFIQVHYSSGKGSKPRWATAGLEYILFVCNPYNTQFLNESVFEEFVSEIESCRKYIIGSAPETKQPGTPLTPVLPRHFRSASSSSMIHAPERSLSIQSTHSESTPSPVINPTDSPLLRRHIMKKSQCSIEKTDTPDCNEKPIDRVRRKIAAMDIAIDRNLQEDKVIGKVSSIHRDKITFKPRSVNFSWQRGFKIGAGRFGKVYTAVNNNTGELMAMKVLPLQPNDHRSIRKVADELRIFEGITHPHLVKCYGVEIHNDEMLMFMEYCDEGTLESLALSTETGLPEILVRKYSRQLMEAVLVLHDRGIVHRDIKGANIFLSEEGNILKLGDFGCAVRIRGHQTEVGELAGIVGTHAYMAPEVFKSNEGHGRAADVWSLGCVVIEMATGKRPWPEYDSSVQIMFRVGMGQSPTIPSHLSEEAHQFLDNCFVHDPKMRATVAQLLDHTFVKIDTGEDCTSLPLFSHTPTTVPYMKLLSHT